MSRNCGEGRWAWVRLGVGVALLALSVAAAAGQSEVSRARSHVASKPAQAAATTAAATVAADTSAALMQMAGAAAVIFAGRVEAVTRNDAAGFVDVRFRIEQPLRGCPKSGVYVLREWAGLWSGHPERYRTGERLLMLLPERGPSGMSAPVGGTDGAIPLVATGAEPLVNGTGVAPPDDGSGADAAASQGVDLRWVAARATRGTVAATGPQRAVVSGGAVGRPVLPSSGDAVADGWSGPVSPLSPSGAGSGAAAAVPPSLNSVLALLRGTTGASNGAR